MALDLTLAGRGGPFVLAWDGWSAGLNGMGFEEKSPWVGTLLGVHRDTHPHWVVDYGCYAVTLRCRGTLPKAVQTQLKEIGAALEAVEPASEDAENYRRRHFAILERALDQSSGFCPFKSDTAAQEMMAFLEAYDHEKLSFEQWVVMPNHLHLLTKPMGCQAVDDFIRAWRRFKSRSARAVNQTLARNGPFWQSSWYDRWIRSPDEWRKWSNYLAHNPVKAGLSPSAAAYPYFRSHVVERPWPST
ncbi:MAG: REP-associated tyrosine transposase [Opitutales bacterium]